MHTANIYGGFTVPSPMLGLEDTGHSACLHCHRVRAESQGITRRVREDPQEERDPQGRPERQEVWAGPEGMECEQLFVVKAGSPQGNVPAALIDSSFA